MFFARAAATATLLATAVAAPPAHVDVGELMATVRTLASPEMEGRRAGTEGGARARGYLVGAFKRIGLDETFPAYQQTFGEGTNVVGGVPGRTRDARTIVVSAHYDHLGVRNGRVYPGADDNASGVAVLLECARYLRVQPPRHRVLFAAFDAEEGGLKGAEAFVRNPPVPRSAIAIDVNFDMVGRDVHHTVFAAGTYEYPWLVPILEPVRHRSTVTVEYGHDRPRHHTSDPDDWTRQSDHGRFYEAGIPFVYFGVEDHPDYHQPGDTTDTIDPAFFGHMAETLLDAVLALDDHLGR